MKPLRYRGKTPETNSGRSAAFCSTPIALIHPDRDDNPKRQDRARRTLIRASTIPHQPAILAQLASALALNQPRPSLCDLACG